MVLMMAIATISGAMVLSRLLLVSVLLLVKLEMVGVMVVLVVTVLRLWTAWMVSFQPGMRSLSPVKRAAAMKAVMARLSRVQATWGIASGNRSSSVEDKKVTGEWFTCGGDYGAQGCRKDPPALSFYNLGV